MVNSENCVCVNPSVTTFMIAAVNSLVLKWVSSLETFIRYMYVLMYVIDTPPSVYIHTQSISVCTDPIVLERVSAGQIYEFFFPPPSLLLFHTPCIHVRVH